MSTRPGPRKGALKISPAHHDALLKVFDQGVVALDVETTGLSPLTDKIIELSAVKVLPKERELAVFDHLINPQMAIPAYTTDIHGITDTMVQGMPTIEKVLPRFFDFIGELPLIAHNAAFDTGFLIFDLHQNSAEVKIDWPQNKIFCSCRLSRASFPQFKGHGLAYLAKELEIKLQNHHRALDDAYSCLEVFAHSLMQKIDSHQQLKAAHLFSLQDFKNNQLLSLPQHLGSLIELIKKQDLTMMKYSGGSHGKEERPIRPISLLPMPAGSVLYAHCLLSDHYKSFALRKIKSARKASEQEMNKWLAPKEKNP